MKKIALLCALILVAGLGFAQEEEAGRWNLFNLEITLGVPITWTNSPAEHQFYDDEADLDKTITANTAFGISLLFNFGRSFGMILEGDFFFGSNVMGASDTSSYSTSLFGAHAFFGPVFYLYSSPTFRIPLAIGAHFRYWTSELWLPDYLNDTGSDIWVSTSDMQLGAGLSIGMQFHFNENLYMFSRTSVAVSIFRWHSVQTDGDVDEEHAFEVTLGWHVKPTLGIGIKF